MLVFLLHISIHPIILLCNHSWSIKHIITIFAIDHSSITLFFRTHRSSPVFRCLPAAHFATAPHILFRLPSKTHLFRQVDHFWTSPRSNYYQGTYACLEPFSPHGKCLQTLLYFDSLSSLFRGIARLWTCLRRCTPLRLVFPFLHTDLPQRLRYTFFSFF